MNRGKDLIKEADERGSKITITEKDGGVLIECSATASFIMTAIRSIFAGLPEDAQALLLNILHKEFMGEIK